MLGPPLSSKVSSQDISKINDSITVGDDFSNERRRSFRNPVIKAPMNIYPLNVKDHQARHQQKKRLNVINT